MNLKKNTGSYYTPDYLSGFMLRHVANYFSVVETLSIFEPSVGSGSFVRSFNKTNFPKSISRFNLIAVEKIKPELKKAANEAALNRKKNSKYTFIRNDFLEYQKDLKRNFHLIIGNPPYIKNQLLNDKQRELCYNIHDSIGNFNTSVKNIWAAFLLRSCQLLKHNGILAFVLPAEVLQVKFSQQIRNYLITIFQRIEIFTFDDLLFDCKGQDIVILFGYKQHHNPGQFYTNISNISQLESNSFILANNNALVKNNTKWTHHILSADDLTFMYNLSHKLYPISHYCNSKPGIVTAANSFFIINKDTEMEYNLTDYAKPIIQKGLLVNGRILFDKTDFNEILLAGKPAKVLIFNNKDINSFPIKVQSYLRLGETMGLSKRHKCTKRETWFIIPNISNIPQGFFFRRCHFYPKLLKNCADVLVTDSAYKIEMKYNYNIGDLLYSFYNSLTLAFAELFGRYYGGGVLELTPHEFKNLPIPFVSITPKEFSLYSNSFENKNKISDVLSANDFYILNSILKLDIEEVDRVRKVYNMLVSKRLRNNSKIYLSKQDP